MTPTNADPDPSAHQPRARLVVTRIGLLILVVLLLAGVLTGGDLPVLPAIALVLLAWCVIVVSDTLHWLLRTFLPTLVPTARTALVAAWNAIANDPVGRCLHRLADRLTPLATRLRPAGRWVKHRFGQEPAGLMLSLALTTATAASVGLWRVGHSVDDPHSGLSRFDLRVADIALRLELPGQRRVMEAITNIGNTRSILILAALLITGSLSARAWRSAALLLGTLATSSLLVTFLKLRHARPRPALGQLVETSTSFPSGHAAASLSLVFGFLVWWWASGRKHPALVAAIVIPVGLLIGYSRAYLSIHWLSDVAAGWLVAALAVAVVLTVDRLIVTRRPHQGSHHAPRRAPILTVTALAALAATTLAVTGSQDFPTHAPTTQPTRLASTSPTKLLSVLPRYSETLFGRHMEPVGLVIVAPETQLRTAIRRSGWSIADPISPGRLLRTYWAGIQNRSDLTAPVTPTFLDTHIEDLAIQRQSLGKGVKARHHARLWRLPLETPQRCQVWAVTASLDDRVEWTLRTVLPNHHIDPAIDAERELLARALRRPAALDDLGRFRLVKPTLGTNAAGDPFFTDGNIAILRQPGCS